MVDPQEGDMTRYIQQDNLPKEEEKKPRELTKPGSYTAEDLAEAKDRPMLGGNYQ